MSKVNFEDKVDLVDNPTIPEKNKLTAQNINDMKKGINDSVTVKIDDVIQTNLDMSTTRDTASQKVHVQVKTLDGKTVCFEVTSSDVRIDDNVTLEQVLNGQGFFIKQENGLLYLGTYEEWLAAGKPSFTA